jgi:triacylglycerol lipase
MVMSDVIDNDFDSPDFSIKTGYYLANASNFAYEDEIGQWTEKLGLENKVEFFSCGQFHGFVGILGKRVLLAFRGTDSIANCLTDLEAILISQSPYPGKVHSGFAGGVEEVLPSIRKLLPHPSRTEAIWITGHSLGGAMATLISVRLAKAGYPVRVYTYGSPRVGDRFFRKNYHLSNYRFVCDNDLVPHLPFRWCYKHVGRLKFLDHEGNLTEEKAVWKAKKHTLAPDAKHIQRKHRRKIEIDDQDGDFDWLTDHYLEQYLDAISKIVLRASRIRRFDRPSDVSRRTAKYVHRLDSSSPKSHQRKFTVSEADFIAAFSQQPQDKSWLRVRSSR